jgi:hypothetical protein
MGLSPVLTRNPYLQEVLTYARSGWKKLDTYLFYGISLTRDRLIWSESEVLSDVPDRAEEASSSDEVSRVTGSLTRAFLHVPTARV